MSLKRKGPIPGPFQASKLKYKCPVFECHSAKILGDNIAEHFRSHANLITLNKKINLKIWKSSLISGLWFGIVQFLNRNIQACN